MKGKLVLNLSAMDFGGAGKFAVNFNRLLLEAGYDSYLIAKDVRGRDSHTIRYPREKTEQTWNKLSRQVAKWRWASVDTDPDRYYYGAYEQYSTVSAKTILRLLPGKPSVIFIHWVTNFITSELVSELQQLSGARIIWLMLDNAPITGGCHFPWNCESYQSTCNNCPAIITADKKQLAADNLAFKKQHLPAESSLLVFSQNDYERAKASALFSDKQILKMPGYFVDEKKFCPGDQAAARQEFGISPDSRVIFFGATSLGEKRKGMCLFLEAIKQIDQSNVTLLVAGSSKLPIDAPNLKLVGNLSEEQLIKAYQAADMFVCPTLEDSGPTMINQAIMVGTPVVSFATGLGRDLVHTGETGYLAQFGDSTDLARGIDFLLNKTQAEKELLSQNCRNLALRLYGGTDRYTDIVKDLVQNLEVAIH